MLRSYWLWIVLACTLLGGCASLPPGADFPRTPSQALAHPEQTRLGAQAQASAAAHPGQSGFRLLSAGADGFLVRMQMIHAAAKTIDMQYFIFHGDDTGQLLTGAVLQAAARGVRVRILVDDGETAAGDEQIALLAAHPMVELRVFNPFRYRGHINMIRAAEFMLDFARLDHRMHNKLIVVDNAVALIGGRNIGDQYFQIDPDGQFADDDLFSTGPVVKDMSASFDQFWASPKAIPVQALAGGLASFVELDEHRQHLRQLKQERKDEAKSYVTRIASGEPLAGVLSGQLPLIWANARLVGDRPDKPSAPQEGDRGPALMHGAVVEASAAAQSELLMVTPYLIPGREGMRIFDALRQRKVRVRILTSSLISSTVLLAQSGYMHYRVPLLKLGVELYEVRAQLGNTRGSGQTQAISSFGNYALHAKLFVFDRKQVLIGSMNFDQRSLHLNTEVGLLIDSPVLAQQIASRFEAMVQAENAYALNLDPSGALEWRTREGGKELSTTREPARSGWQRFSVNVLALLPLDDEL
ncbi:MAG: phospholipase D family protein [Pseudomonadota bacterium]